MGHFVNFGGIFRLTLVLTSFVEVKVLKRHAENKGQIVKITENVTFLTFLMSVKSFAGIFDVKNCQKLSKSGFLAFLAQKASKVIISLFSGF